MPHSAGRSSPPGAKPGFRGAGSSSPSDTEAFRGQLLSGGRLGNPSIGGPWGRVLAQSCEALPWRPREDWGALPAPRGWYRTCHTHSATTLAPQTSRGGRTGAPPDKGGSWEGRGPGQATGQRCHLPAPRPPRRRGPRHTQHDTLTSWPRRLALSRMEAGPSLSAGGRRTPRCTDQPRGLPGTFPLSPRE